MYLIAVNTVRKHYVLLCVELSVSHCCQHSTQAFIYSPLQQGLKTEHKEKWLERSTPSPRHLQTWQAVWSVIACHINDMHQSIAISGHLKGKHSLLACLPLHDCQTFSSCGNAEDRKHATTAHLHLTSHYFCLVLLPIVVQHHERSLQPCVQP